MADNYTLKNGFTTIQRGDGAVWIDRTKGVEDVDPGWYMKGGVRAPDTDTAPAPPTPPAGSGVQGTGIPAGMTKYTLKNNIDTFQRGDGAVWIDHTKGVPDAQPGWYYKGGHRAPDTDAAPFTPNQGIAQGMGLQGAAQGPSSPYTPAQIPAGALSSNPIADWALRKAVATPTGQAVGDVATQAALIPGRTVGRAVSDVAGLGYLASAQAKAHPILGRALRVATQMTPEQMQQGAQTIQEYERPFLETELQPTTTAGEWTKKGGELAGMAGEAALLGPAAAAAYGLQGAGARATAIQGKATPNQMLAETGLSGLTNFALAQFMPAGKLPTPQAGALWQFAKDLAMQGSKGAAAGAAMGVGENLISKIHDPNAPIFTKDVGQNALQFAGFEMGHTLLKLPVYQDIASQRRAVLDHPEGPAGVSADATRMIDAVNAAKDNGLVDPESAQGHIDTLTRMKDLADRIAQTRAGKKAQAAADKAKATAEQAAAPAAEPAPAAPAAPTPEASATPTELPTFGEDSIKAARLTDLRAMFGARGIEMPTGMGKDELKKYLLKDQETRSPKPPEEVPSAAQEGQVEEGHPGEHPGGDQVSEGEGIVRQPEGAGQEAAPVNRSGGIQEGGEVPEAVKIEPTDAEIMGPAPRTTTPPESVIPEEVKEANREDHEARLLQQIRPELQERFTTDLNSAKDILDNRADTVISRLTPIDAQIDRIERAFARREAKGRIPSAEEALDQNADYQRLLKERESILSDGHAAIESIHDSSAILADRYGLDKQEIRRAIMGLGSEDEGTSPTRTETGAEAGAEQRIPPTAGEPEGRATEAGLPEHADEAGVQGGIPGTEGGAGVGEAGAEAHRGAEAPEAPEAEGRAIGAAPEGTAGEGNVGAEGEAGEGGKAPDYSRPANAAKRERIAADNLGLQGLYEKGFDLVKKQLNLPEGATEMDLVHEVGNRIGKLGASVMDTARKIMATFKGIGKDMAQSLANLLHELNPFQGREGELGAVGEKRPHEQEIHDAVNEMYPGEENKALRRLIYQQGGILSAKTKELGMLRVGEFLKGASFDENGNFKVLSPKERAARVAAGIPAPIFDPTKVAKPEEAPKQLAPFMKDVADLGVQANENGVYPVGHVPTDMNANNVKLRGKDLNVLERAAAWLVPRSHILTGTMRWGRGAMYLREIPEVDKLLQTIHSLDVQQKNYGAFVKKMDELGIENHSKEIQERLQPFRDALGEAQAEYERARMNRKGNTDAIADPKFKATEKQAWFKVLAAHETVEDEMLKLAQDKKFSDARVAMLADQFDDPPDELLKLASPQEMKAAEWIKGMLDVYRSAAEREGLLVLKGSYFIHQVKEGLSSGVWDKMQEAGVKGLGLMENWQDLKIDPNAEDVRFAHRQPGGQLTLPDLYGGMGAYIEKATNLITKRQIVNKWTQAARLMDDAGYKNLANFINKDMEGYIKGYADQHYEWMDTMTRAWQMKQTALKVATAAKHTAKMPNSIVESGILNNAEAVKLLMGWDSLPKEVGDPLRQMVKTMVDASHFSRLEVGTGDVKADFARGALDKIIASGHQPVQFIEGAERAVNFAAALIDGYKRGLSPVDAMREAAGRSLLTNFSGVDQPLYARGSVGQAVGVFQGTVNKIMWLNVKRSGDIVKGLTGLMQGRELDAEEKRGLVVGLKAAVMMGAVTALSKKLDIPYDEWMREHPQVYNILLHPLKVAASSIWNAAADKDHKWNVPEADWKREIMNFQLAPIVTQTLDDYDKYGYMTAGEKLLTPAAASDWFQAKSPQTAKRYGEPGLERGIRKVTGAFKPSVKEEQEEAAGEKKEARQAAAAKKWGESWGMPGR